MKQLFLITILFPTLLFAQTAVWNGSVNTDWYTSNPSASAYTITTAEQLAGLAQLVNDGTTTFSDKTITLGANIILNDTAAYGGWRKWDNSTTGLEQWISIGNSANIYLGISAHSFRGSFDGNGKVIIGLYINTTSYYDQGLFGYVGSGGSVSNLGVVGFYLKGLSNVGGITGYNSGTVKNSYSIVNVFGTGDDVGCIAGKNTGTIANSYVIGDVSGSSNVGGIAGSNVSGSSRGTIANSYFAGNVSGTGSNIGGIVGVNEDIVNLGTYGTWTYTGTVSNSYYNSDFATAGNLNSLGTSKTTVEMQAGTFRTLLQINASALNAADESNNYMSWIYNTNGYPYLSDTKAVNDYFAGDGTAADPYVIMTKSQLEDLAVFVNTGKTFQGEYIKLGVDIVLNDTSLSGGWRNWNNTTTGLEQWVPIGNTSNNFSGTFDGNGKSIAGLYRSSTAAYQGLFGYVGSGGSISNLGLAGSYVKGGNYTGGIAGTIGSNSTISNSYSAGNVSGTGNYVGGIAGTVGSNSTVSNSYSIGDVSGTDYVGGISGSGGTIVNSYSVGNVLGTSNVGGITGYNGTVYNSYYNSDLATSINLNQLGTPASTEQMKTQSTYSAWDFTNIWAIFAKFNDGYPIFQIQVPSLQIATIAITPPQPPYPYTGDSIKPSVTVTYAGNLLIEDTHYTISYNNNVNAGRATITVTGIGSYVDSNFIEFTITPSTNPNPPFPAIEPRTTTFAPNRIITSVPLPSGYEWMYSDPITHADDNQQFTAKYTSPNYVNYATGTVLVNVAKAQGTGTASIDASWKFGEDRIPTAESSTNPSANVVYHYEGTGETNYPKDTARPVNAGSYAMTATFPANQNYEAHTTDPASFTINKAEGDCHVKTEGWAFGKTPSAPDASTATNNPGTAAITYKGITVTYEETKSIPSVVGKYEIKAVFPETGNHLECRDSSYFYIYLNTLAPTAETSLKYNGYPLTGVKQDAAGKYTLSGNVETDAGTHTATATLTSGNSWDDGSLEPLRIEWKIEQADGIFYNPGACSGTYREGLVLRDITGLPKEYDWEKPDSSLSAGQNQQLTAVYIQSKNHKPVSGSVTVNVDKAPGTFRAITTIAKPIEHPYEQNLRLGSVPFPSGCDNCYKWTTPMALLDTGASSHEAEYADPSGNYNPAKENVHVRVVKGTGKASYASISGWTYGGEEKEPIAISLTNHDVTPAFYYSGRANDSTDYGPSLSPPKKAGSYTLKASFPANGYYNSFDTTISFKILKAPGSGEVKIAGGWYFGEEQPEPVLVEGKNGMAGVTYRYLSKDGYTVFPNPGKYIIEAAFPETPNYLAHKDSADFEIWKANVQITWTPACGHEYTYNGKEQSPTPSATGYTLNDFVLTGAGTDADSYTMTAELKTPDNGVNLQNAACPYTIAKKTLQVEWTADSVFTYNKMDQSPRASLAVPEPGVEFEYTNRKSSVGKYEGGDGVRVDIMDKSIADNYILANRIKNYEILKKDLNPYFAAIYPEDFPPSADTLWVSHEVFADSTLLLEVLEDLIDYDGFATDTIKNETDNATVLKGKAKVKIKYDDDEDGNSQGKQSRAILAKRVETTQKATATIITDNVSADNYKPLVRPTAIVILATVVEDDNAPQIYCKRNSKYAEIGRNTCGAIGGEVFEELFCVIDATCTQITANFSLNACTSLDGEPVPTCNETPITHTPNPIPYTPVTPHYYTLKGTSLGTTKPTTPGIYIAKIGKQTMKIMVK